MTGTGRGDQRMEVGIGTSQLRSLGRRASIREVRALMESTRTAGVRWIDTADTYGAGSAERALARAATGGHPPTRLVTKIGYRTPDLPRPLHVLNQPLKKIVQRRRPQSFDTRDLARAWAASRRRLGDLPVHACCLHNPPASVLEQGDAVSLLVRLRDSGAFRAVGVSIDDAATASLLIGLRDVDLVELPAAVWVELSEPARRTLLDRGTEVVVNRVSDIGRPPAAALARLADDPLAPTAAVVGTRDPAHLLANAAAVRR